MTDRKKKADDLYRQIRANPRYLEAILRFLRYGEFPEELEGERYPNLERIAAEIKRERQEREQ